MAFHVCGKKMNIPWQIVGAKVRGRASQAKVMVKWLNDVTGRTMSI
jgi:hypothetical protein